VFPTPEGPWSPRNDEGDYHDEVTLVKALAKSLNVATANLVDSLGPRVVARYVERFGLGTPQPVASIGLGTHEVTLTALTGAYATFANDGLRCEPTTVRAVVDARGPVLPAPPSPPRVIPSETAALMAGMLEDVVVFGVSYPLRKVYGVTRPVGGKTGTTNDYRDAWFVGFTPTFAAGVWIGFDQPQPLNAPAAEIALPVWADAAKTLLAGFPPAPFPYERALVPAWIDSWSGGLASGSCPSVIRAYFLPGQTPTVPCRRDHAAEWARLAAQQAAVADSSVDSLYSP
jgi:penicillin-binding protein 1A